MLRRSSLQFGIELRQEEPPRKDRNLPAKTDEATGGRRQHACDIEAAHRTYIVSSLSSLRVEILLRISREFARNVEWLLMGEG
jgi:hypothetical protein